MARYGRRHHELRLRLLPQFVGKPCARCGKPMRDPARMDLDHRDDGIGYIGFSHRACNRSTAGRNPKGYTRTEPPPESSGPRPGWDPPGRSVTRW